MQYLSALAHPDEFLALLKLGYARAGAPSLRENPRLSANLRWTYDMLDKTSRSFAFVIQELPDELRDATMVFYLILRGLDTVEDDMSVALEKKVPVLQQFHEKLLQPGWNVKGYGEKPEEKMLVENFDKVIDIFLTLPEKYQRVIKDITKRMGAGMAEFCQRPVVTMEDYNLYCHYVAGVVGIGCSGLFAASGLESQWYATADDVSNSMGLFLQKVNITRDYLEDINQVPKSRIFWPREIWSKYTDKLENFKNPQYAKQAVHCLNDQITDALTHATACIEYMERLRDPAVFKFCAIPQVMAMATLAACYNNHGVFTGVVKIRRGQNAKIMLDLQNRGMTAIYEHFLYFANEIANKIPNDDPNAAKTREVVNRLRAVCEAHVGTPSSFGMGDVVAFAAFAASSAYLVTKHNRRLFAKL